MSNQLAVQEVGFQITPATRQAVRPIIAMYGESGSGKTYSALLLARGIVGPSGRIVIADSESGRGSLYADVLPGGYDTLALSEPFSPARYIEAMRTIEESGAAVGVLDSASHEWEGIGGVLDMAAENEGRSGKAGLHNWKVPKMEHAKWILKLIQSPIPWVVCLRAKYKSRQTKEHGKTVIVKDDSPSPIQAEDFIFEATAHMLIQHDHTIRLTKWSHPALKDCFPADGKAPLSIGHGEAIASWASAGKTSGPQKAPAGDDLDEALREKAKAGLRAVAKEHFRGSMKELQQYAWDNGILDTDSESLSDISAERLTKVQIAIRAKLQPEGALI